MLLRLKAGEVPGSGHDLVREGIVDRVFPDTTMCDMCGAQCGGDTGLLVKVGDGKWNAGKLG